MLTVLYGRVLQPFHERVVHGRRTFRYLAELQASQWSDPVALEALRLEGLRRLLAYAHRWCPYYAAEWDRLGLSPDRVRTFDDFRRWPLVTREDIRAHRGRMRTTEPGVRLIAKATGGSSGVPLQFDLNRESHERREAAARRGYGWAGAGPGTRQFYLWGVSVGAQTRWRRLKDRMYNRVQRRTVVSSFVLSRDSIPAVAAELNACRPHAVVAYTSALYTLARELADRQIVPYSPRSIVVGAERLYPFQRQLIERVFGAPVFETYGSREVMLMGAECDRHAGLHLTAENLLVEVTDDDGRPTPDGAEGNVVVTDLTNTGMPFVRYLNGDRAVAGFGRCPCGRGLPLLKQVTGRRLDVIHTPDGRQVPGEFFPHLVKDFPAVERFQVVQEVAGRVEVRLVVRPEWQSADGERLDRGLRGVLGPACRIDITLVPDIPLTAQGKLQVVVSRVRATATAPDARRPAVTEG